MIGEGDLRWSFYFSGARQILVWHAEQSAGHEICLLTARAQKICLCQDVLHGRETRGLEGKWCSLTVHIPWLLNLNLAMSHKAYTPWAEPTCPHLLRPITHTNYTMPTLLSGALKWGSGKPLVSQIIHIQGSQIFKFDSLWLPSALSQWGLGALFLLFHYFPIIRSCATKVFQNTCLCSAIIVSEVTLYSHPK